MGRILLPFLDKAEGGSLDTQKVFKYFDKLICQSLLLCIGQGLDFFGIEYLGREFRETLVNILKGVRHNKVKIVQAATKMATVSKALLIN